MPSRFLTIPFERLFSAAGHLTFGAYGIGVSAGDNVRTGFYTEAFRTPDDMDRSRPARLWYRIFNPTYHVVAQSEVYLRIGMTRSPVDVTPTNTLGYDFITIPENWPTGIPMQLEMLSDNSAFIQAKELGLNDLCQFRVERYGDHEDDTWPFVLGFASSVVLEYSQNCRYGCL